LCHECGIGESELPSLSRVYNEDYAHLYVSYLSQDLGHKIVKHRVQELQKLTNLFGWESHRCSTLDFGCATGIVVREARELGLDAWGYEPHAVFFNSHHALHVAPWIAINPESIVSTPFVVSFYDALEHLERVDKWLQLFQPIRIVVTLPVVPLTMFSKDLPNWKHYKPDEHVWYFTDNGIHNFLAAHGYEVYEVEDFERKLGRLDALTVHARRIEK